MFFFFFFRLVVSGVGDCGYVAILRFSNRKCNDIPVGFLLNSSVLSLLDAEGTL